VLCGAAHACNSSKASFEGVPPFLVLLLLTCLESFNRIVLAMSEYVISSVKNLRLSFPLDTLVRTSSRRRRPNLTQITLAQEGSREASESQYIFVPTLDTPPKKSHTRFRALVATQSSVNNPVGISGCSSHSQMRGGSQGRDEVCIGLLAMATVPSLFLWVHVIRQIHESSRLIRSLS
jgi:hypothetical protein